MVYSYKNKKEITYYLHSREGRGGAKLFFFSKSAEESIDLPPEFNVIENPVTGLPMVKKK